MPRRHKPRRGGELLLAKTKLADVIAALSHRRLHAVRDIDGKAKYTRLSSRYDELADAVESARGGSGGKWNHQLPFWADAFVLLREIDTAVAQLHPAPSGWTGWTKQRLEALEQHRWRPQDSKTIYAHVVKLEELCARVDKLFAPKPISLPNACPECKQRYVYRDVDGENIKTAALQINESGCTCGGCQANWPIDRLQLLGKILGYTQQDTCVAS